MNGDWQTWAALTITAIAALSLVRHAWKRLRPTRGSCGTGCGVCPTPAPRVTQVRPQRF
ncbi:MAG: hypothetical protein KGS60_15890 [Verrucomicrobia bacterium]|nr:hypothetical protein [Verrucomicrobiota bacterium]